MDSPEIERYVTELSSLVDRIDPNKVVFSYDYDSDTLMIHLLDVVSQASAYR
jgi:hypothetical protein